MSIGFIGTITRGFADPAQPNVAVCLLPGTELAFDREVAYYVYLPGPEICTAGKVAKFTQVDVDKQHVHHDAIEFPDEQRVLLTHLVEGQTATVLQLPVDPDAKRIENHEGTALQTMQAAGLPSEALA